MLTARACAGVHALGLYCLHDDGISVTLGDVALLANDRCTPYQEEGIVFRIVPLFLPAGLYALEYTVRTRNATTVMIADVPPQYAPGVQPAGRLSAMAGVLYMPTSANDLIAGVAKQGGVGAQYNIGVVDHGFGK